MSYIVYHVKSTMKHKIYATLGAAKGAATRLNKKAGYEKYAATDIEDYKENVVYYITKKNLMSGKPIQVASNCPASCDPSCETYWSM